MKIALLGYGTVGYGVVELIDKGAQNTKSLEMKRILMREGAEMCDVRMTQNYEDILNDEEIECVVECIGGLEPAHSYVKKALEHGKHCVTSNKKMLATYYSELLNLARANGVQIRYEATCGGGIPWMHELEHMRRIDEVTLFSGIMNGTTNYILSNMTEFGLDFKEMLKKAQELGYAEADPTDDIDGYDVRYKVCLSAAAAFDRIVKPEEIPAFGIRSISAKDIEWAKGQGRIIKLIGNGELDDEGNLSASVFPHMLKNTEVLANVGRNLNAIEANSTTLGPSCYIGQGAGRYPTAHAVIQDILSIEENPKCEMKEVKEATVKDYSDKRVFYVSGNTEPFADLQDESYLVAFVTKPCSVKEMAERLAKTEQTPFVAILDE